MKTSSYLQFNGNCEQAMAYYADVLGGELTQTMRFSDAPEADIQFPKEVLNLIMHCQLEVSNVKILASDYVSEHSFVQGNNFAISLTSNDEDEANAVFQGLADGGQILMPFEEAFWGGKFGMCVDKFGVNWMMSLEQDNNYV